VTVGAGVAVAVAVAATALTVAPVPEAALISMMMPRHAPLVAHVAEPVCSPPASLIWASVVEVGAVCCCSMISVHPARGVTASLVGWICANTVALSLAGADARLTVAVVPLALSTAVWAIAPDPFVPLVS
jgi:hypothetical protein